MRAMLVNGKILQPGSRAEAQEREALLLREVTRIEEQLADPARIGKFPNQAEYDRWKRRARASLGYLSEEARQIRAWLDAPELTFAVVREHAAQYPRGCPHKDCAHPVCQPRG